MTDVDRHADQDEPEASLKQPGSNRGFRILDPNRPILEVFLCPNWDDLRERQALEKLVHYSK